MGKLKSKCSNSRKWKSNSSRNKWNSHNNSKVDGTDYSDTCTVSIVQKVTAISAENLTVGKKWNRKNKCNNNTKWASRRFNIYIRSNKYSNSSSKMEQ